MSGLTALEQGSAVATTAAAGILDEEVGPLIDLWQQALEALLAGQELEQLQGDLRGTPGGGPSVAALALRALRAAAQQAQHSAVQQQQVVAEGEAAAGGMEGRAGAESGPAPHSLPQLVAALQQVSWEKLHSGCWHEVGMAWRDAYSLSCLLAAAGAMLWPPPEAGRQPLGRGQGGAPGAAGGGSRGVEGSGGGAVGAGLAEGLRKALRELDMAAIMGGPLFRSYVDTLIEQLQMAWQRLVALPTGEQHQQEGEEAEEKAAAGGWQPREALAAGSSTQPRRQQHLSEGEEEGEGQLLPPAVQAGAGFGVLLPPDSMGPRGTPVPLEELPSLETFWREYMNREGGPIPVLIDGGMQMWPALCKWQDVRYLRSVAGPRTVPVEVGEHYLADQWGQQLMTLQDFIDTYILGRQAQGPGGAGGGPMGPQCPPFDSVATAPSGALDAPAGEEQGGGCTAASGGGQGGGTVEEQEGGCTAATGGGRGDGAAVPAPRGYLAQHPLFEQIPALAADIREPDYCCLGEGELQSVNAWFGPAGTVTPLHTDPHHNLLCQAVGRKYLRLYCPEDTPAMHPFSEGMTTNSSQVDLDAPDPASFPLFAAAHFQDCILRPGQMLYIPPGWWHYVKSLDTSFSVSFWWK